MSQTFDERVAKLAVTSRILEEADLCFKDSSRTLADIKDVQFNKIVKASKTTSNLSGVIVVAGLSYTAAVATMGGSLVTVGIIAGTGSILSLLGLPLLGPFAIIGIAGYLFKKKEREKRERLEKDLQEGEKLALQKIIRKQNSLIQELKKIMQEINQDKDEIKKNMEHTRDYVKQKEERIEYLERLLAMLTMAGDALEGAA
ncbi:hypothetical protein D3C74_48650 [compost metagenome]